MCQEDASSVRFFALHVPSGFRWGVFEHFAYIQLRELVKNTLQTLVKVLLRELDLAHVEVTDTADGKVGMDDLYFKRKKLFCH